MKDGRRAPRAGFAFLLAVASAPTLGADAAWRDGERPPVVSSVVSSVAEGPAIVVSATRSPHAAFDLPLAADVLDARRIAESGPRLMAVESLNRLPGTLVLGRETLSQEPQIVLRGFGARSQFGVRGIRLLADGIPASTPDGQGGSGLFDFASAARLEVTRGAFSALHGNHSGGVVQIITEDGPRPPELSGQFALGGYGQRFSAVKLAGQWDMPVAGDSARPTGGLNAVASLSDWRSDGYRAWSAARKQQFNARLRYAISADTRVSLVANRLDQPENLDPLGLTAAQMATDRRQANPAALTFATRRSLRNEQLGLVVEHRLAGGDELRAMAYGGSRNNTQYLALSGIGATSSGGVSRIDREFVGAGLRWSGLRGARDEWTWTAGLDTDLARDERRGYVNNNGVIGALRRDETDTARQDGVYVQTEWQFAPAWALHGGLRYSRVRFDSRDRYIVAGNPDDSGTMRYAAWTPALGLVYRAAEDVNVYANLGRGFETPTFVELAYRSDGVSGLNTALRASLSTQAEVGVKAALGREGRGGYVQAALFDIATRDEIVVDSNLGGRTTYRNAGATTRRGLELSWSHGSATGIGAEVAATWLRAAFRDGFVGNGGGSVAAGNRLPGVPALALFGELAYRDPAKRWFVALEGRWQDKLWVNDANAEAAAGFFVAGVRLGAQQRHGDWRIEQFLRVDNLFDREYVGAVYVNDGNGRYYAPAAARRWLAGLRISVAY